MDSISFGPSDDNLPSTSLPQSGVLRNGDILNNTSIDFDEIDSSLRVVQECMERLERSSFGEDKSQPDASDVEACAGDLDTDDGGTGSAELLSSAVGDLMVELDSVALDWESFRTKKECSCSTTFDHFGRKLHCHTCGQVFCIRCIDKKIALPGHYSKEAVPVCRSCYKNIMRSNSIDCI